jgi:hypothetical protein
MIIKTRTQRELDMLLRSVIQNYDSALAVFKCKKKARDSVIQGYDDLKEWLYPRKSFRFKCRCGRIINEDKLPYICPCHRMLVPTPEEGPISVSEGDHEGERLVDG